MNAENTDKLISTKYGTWVCSCPARVERENQGNNNEACESRLKGMERSDKKAGR